jgi:transcriptional regulator with XRE-family HTH domain
MPKLLNLDDLISGARVKTQKALGEEAGVDQRTISRWRKGAPVDLESIMKMISAAKVPARIQNSAGETFFVAPAEGDGEAARPIIPEDRELAELIAWLTHWAVDMSAQVDEGHEVADIIVDFGDASRWNDETIRLKKYVKDGLPYLERLVELMRDVPDETGAESAAYGGRAYEDRTRTNHHQPLLGSGNGKMIIP